MTTVHQRTSLRITTTKNLKLPCKKEDCVEPRHKGGMCKMHFQMNNLGDCSICFEPMDKVPELVQIDRCHHHFHETCIMGWLHSGSDSCPLCRGRIL